MEPDRRENRVIDDRDLRDKLAEIERLVRELRGARHAITDDLQWAEKEADRLRRHMANTEKER